MLLRTPSLRAILIIAAIALALIGGGAYLAFTAPAAAADTSAYTNADICPRPEPIDTHGTCIAEVPATVSDEEETGTRSITYDVQVRYANGTTQWANDVGSDLYDAVNVGDSVTVHLWRGTLTWIDDGAGDASTTADYPARREQNNLLGAWWLGAGGICVLGYAQLSLERRRVVPRAAETATPVPDVASWLRTMALCVYLGVGASLFVDELDASIQLLSAAISLAAGAVIAWLLHRSLRLRLMGSTLRLDGWRIKVHDVPVQDIRQVRRGRATVWRAGAQPFPLARIRFSTARNDAFLADLQHEIDA